jgi:predicted phage terminase large subunit-like protein
MTDRLKELDAELLRRDALEDIFTFGVVMRRTGSADFANTPAKHHRLILEKLSDLEAGRIKNLMILAPPGSAKSTYASIQFVLWVLAKHPDWSILCASNSQDLATEFNRRRRNIALHPIYADLMGTTLDPTKAGQEHFTTLKEGGVRSAGVGSTITGNRADLLVLDDPVSGIEQALSLTELEKQWSWWNYDFVTRGKLGCRKLVITTRWSVNDISGKLLETEGGEWEVLELPLVCDSTEDPLGREIGEVLWPENYPPEKVAKYKADRLLFACLCQQKPVDRKGVWCSEANIKYDETAPILVNRAARVLTIDAALSVDKGDYSVLCVVQLDSEKKMHVIDVHREQMSPDGLVDKIFELVKTYSIQTVLGDEDSILKSLRVAIQNRYERDRIKDSLPPFHLHLEPMGNKDKQTRNAPLRAEILSGNFFLLRGDWNPIVVSELVGFPGLKHDDIVDSLGLVPRRLLFLTADEADLEKVRARDAETTRGTISNLFAEHERRMRSIRRRA